MAYAFWTCFMIYEEYINVALMRCIFWLLRSAVLINSHQSGVYTLLCFQLIFTKCIDYKTKLILNGQAVYNTKQYAKLMKKREAPNWLGY
uniref:Uncharacterized protein n=1 Tax=Arundo donax TaxID=35708 RepID=A0A0A9BXK0_ARUDO